MGALTGLFTDETDRRMSLRHAVMLGTHGEQRSSLRLLTTAPAVIHVNGERHVGLVRDLSSTGLFVYSDFTPELGAEMKITIRLAREKNKNMVFLCSGEAVRVEDARNGSAVGIGVNFAQQLTESPQL